MHIFKGMVIAAIAFFSVSAIQVQAFSDGYILTGCYGGTSTYLIDKNGQIVQQWIHKKLTDSLNGYSAYLLENGNLLRSAQIGTNPLQDIKPLNAAPLQGIIDEIDRMGNVVWTYRLSDSIHMLHHDIKPLPPRAGETEGNILASTFCLETKAEMIRVGVDTTLLLRRTYSILSEKIIEIKKKYPSGGDIVWEWRMFDHVVPKASAAAHPEKISGGIVPALWSGQWVHLNGLDYNPKNDLIVFSSRVFSELYVLDHSTTTAQAAGSTGGKYNKGGDILYRWGKPGNYGVTGLTVDCLHSTTWIPEGRKGAGNILFYHNNITVQKSEVIEICPPVDGNGNFIMQAGTACGPATPTWKYAPTDTTDKFYSGYMSSTMRMDANGNTIIHEAYPPDTGVPLPGGAPKTDSRIREVTYDGQIVDSIRLKIKENPGTGIGMTMAFNPAKIMYYPSTYKGIAALFLQKTGRDNPSRTGTPGPLFTIRQKAGSIFISGVSGCEISMVDLHGKTVLSAKSKTNTFSLRAGRLPAGVCCVTVTRGNKRLSSRMINVSR
jgi:hypothetical protein